LARARAQRLTEDTVIAGGAVDVVRVLGAMQAQLPTATALAIRARSRGLRLEDGVGALNRERTVVRTWLIRGTLHLAAAEDVSWMLDLLGPIFVVRGRRRRLELGLDDDTCEWGVRLLRHLLADGPRSRRELVDGLAARGLTFDPRSQAPIHLIAYAAFRGVLCYGPERNGAETYVLLDDWIDRQPPVSHAAALDALARRYFAGHGPASADVFAAWSGLPLNLAREAAGKIAKSEPGPARRAPASVRLLPAFDEYLLGYRSRAFAISPELERRLQRGGGWIHPAAIVDGQVVGTWRTERRGKQLQALVEPDGRWSAPIIAAVEAQVSDIGRFLGVEAVTRLTPHASG
jgi:hypothetical protein